MIGDGLWCALLEGRVRVVEEGTVDGRGYVILRAHPRGSSLSRRESEVARLLAAGASSKCVALQLGVSASTVSAHLASALCKLEVSTLGHLVRLHERLVGPAKDLHVTQSWIDGERRWIVSQSAPPEPLALTAAERSVAQLVASGLSNAEIAAVRRRSKRTVANQVASLLQKLGIPSRHQVGRLVETPTIPRQRNLRPGSATSTLDSIGESLGAQA